MRCPGGLILAAFLFAVPASAQVVQGGVTSGLSCTFDFDSVPNNQLPWTPYVTITGPGVVIGERLVGQTTTPNAPFEIVAGNPAVPLRMDGAVTRNTGVSVFAGPTPPDLDLGPEGTAGWPNGSSLGEGSFSVLFEMDQKTVGFSIGYSSAPNQAQVLFYDRRGSCIGSRTAAHAASGSNMVPGAFTVKSGPWIAAMTVNNTDTGGLGYDDLRYDYSPLTLSGSPTPGGTVTLALAVAADAGLPYQIGSSLGAGPTPVGNRSINLTVDDLLVVSVSGLLPAVFADYAGRLDPSGKATASIRLPPFPALKGLRIHSAFVTLDAAMPSGIRTISATAIFSIQ